MNKCLPLTAWEKVAATVVGLACLGLKASWVYLVLNVEPEDIALVFNDTELQSYLNGMVGGGILVVGLLSLLMIWLPQLRYGFLSVVATLTLWSAIVEPAIKRHAHIPYPFWMQLVDLCIGLLLFGLFSVRLFTAKSAGCTEASGHSQ
ncbi:MAG: hypothetical protein NTY01_13600 [Verrucomicrobia bacterium]|nr:hypothetical protein [Verrucomicrobiota bacterium]